MMLEFQETPATPPVSLPRAPRIPETCVPCPGLPLKALEISSFGLLSLLTKSQPWRSLGCPVVPGRGLVHRLGWRSGRLASMPVSTTPTTTLGLPVVRSQAVVARRSAPEVGAPPVVALVLNWAPETDCAEFCSAHSWPNRPSLAVARAWRGEVGAADRDARAASRARAPRPAPAPPRRP